MHHVSPINRPRRQSMLLTDEIRDPVRMTVSRQNDSVVDLVILYVIQNAVAVRTVAIPSILVTGKSP